MIDSTRHIETEDDIENRPSQTCAYDLMHCESPFQINEQLYSDGWWRKTGSTVEGAQYIDVTTQTGIPDL